MTYHHPTYHSRRISPDIDKLQVSKEMRRQTNYHNGKKSIKKNLPVFLKQRLNLGMTKKYGSLNNKSSRKTTRNARFHSSAVRHHELPTWIGLRWPLRDHWEDLRPGGLDGHTDHSWGPAKHRSILKRRFPRSQLRHQSRWRHFQELLLPGPLPARHHAACQVRQPMILFLFA